MSAYTLHDAFDMAIQFERNGHAFYTAAAGLAGDDLVKSLLTELADWEREHEKLFKLMRDEAAAAADGPVSAEAAAYVAEIVEGKIFKHHDAAAQKLTAESTVAEIFDLAIEMETSAMLFFIGIRGMVSADADRIDQVIAEEMNHVRILSEQSRKV